MSSSEQFSGWDAAIQDIPDVSPSADEEEKIEADSTPIANEEADVLSNSDEEFPTGWEDIMDRVPENDADANDSNAIVADDTVEHNEETAAEITKKDSGESSSSSGMGSFHDASKDFDEEEEGKMATVEPKVERGSNPWEESSIATDVADNTITGADTSNRTSTSIEPDENSKNLTATEPDSDTSKEMLGSIEADTSKDALGEEVRTSSPESVHTGSEEKDYCLVSASPESSSSEENKEDKETSSERVIEEDDTSGVPTSTVETACRENEDDKRAIKTDEEEDQKTLKKKGSASTSVSEITSPRSNQGRSTSTKAVQPPGNSTPFKFIQEAHSSSINESQETRSPPEKTAEEIEQEKDRERIAKIALQTVADALGATISEDTSASQHEKKTNCCDDDEDENILESIKAPSPEIAAASNTDLKGDSGSLSEKAATDSNAALIKENEPLLIESGAEEKTIIQEDVERKIPFGEDAPSATGGTYPLSSSTPSPNLNDLSSTAQPIIVPCDNFAESAMTSNEAQATSSQQALEVLTTPNDDETATNRSRDRNEKQSKDDEEDKGGPLWQMAKDEATQDRTSWRPPRVPSSISTGSNTRNMGREFDYRYMNQRPPVSPKRRTDGSRRPSSPSRALPPRLSKNGEVEMQPMGGPRSLLTVTMERKGRDAPVPSVIGGDGTFTPMDDLSHKRGGGTSSRSGGQNSFYDDDTGAAGGDLESLSSRFDSTHRTDRVGPPIPMPRQRVKVVQLIVVGVIGIIGGFFGSIFVQSSCHFATGYVTVGNNQEEFEIHAGMWKFSSIDSVFTGYSYCAPYSDDYSSAPPSFSRVFGIIALLAGSMSLTVLWVYIFIIRTTAFFWKWAVRMSMLAAIAQSCTFTFFKSDFCIEHECGMGPGSIISFFSVVSWFCLAYEMYHNSPVSAVITIDNRSFLEKNADNCGMRGLLVSLGLVEPSENNVPNLSSIAKYNQPNGLVRSGSYNLDSSSRYPSYRPPSYEGELA